TIGTVTGGNGPYTYSIDGSGYTSNKTYTDLIPGNHTVAVKDGNGCIYSTTATVGSSGGPTDVNVNTTPASCGATNGGLTIGTVTGGSGPYTYSVDGSGYTSNKTYTDLIPGNHTVAVKDDNGCIYSTTATIGSSGGPTDVAVNTTPAACGATNGGLTIGAVTG